MIERTRAIGRLGEGGVAHPWECVLRSIARPRVFHAIPHHTKSFLALVITGRDIQAGNSFDGEPTASCVYETVAINSVLNCADRFRPGRLDGAVEISNRRHPIHEWQRKC